MVNIIRLSTYIISIANKLANGEEWHQGHFRGGRESNDFLRERGFEVVMKSDNSWRVLSEVVAWKFLDRSSIKYSETGIPQDIRWYFDIEDFQPRDKKKLDLYWNGEHFIAQAKMGLNSRTSMSWGSSGLTTRIQSLFPEFSLKAKSTHGKFDDAPVMTFVKKGKDQFDISFSDLESIISIQKDIEADQIENDESFKEGKVKFYYGKRYERNAVNRKRAIEIHGCRCKVCGFDFEREYGLRGKDFIEVHHNKPLHVNAGDEVEVNPATDLDPVCSNCHRMIHRKADNVLTIEELKRLMYESQQTK